MNANKIEIAIAQINPRIGDIRYNLKLIRFFIKKAREKKIDLLIFPEMVISGYPPEDLLYDQELMYSINKALISIKKETLNGPMIIIGYPKISKRARQFKLAQDFYNAFIIFHKGINWGSGKKICIPNDSIFNEARYFISGNTVKKFKIFNTLDIAVLICEDLWYSKKNQLYPFSPIKRIMKEKIDLLISLNASPFELGKEKARYQLVQRLSIQYKIPILYANLWGNSDGVLFDGSSFVVNAEGKLLLQAKAFKNDLLRIAWNLKTKQLDYSIKFSKKKTFSIPSKSKSEIIYETLVAAKKDYHFKSGFKKSVIGISGGIDSSVALAIDVAALGSENVFAILSPSRYSSEEGLKYAKILCKNFNVSYKIIPLEIRNPSNNVWEGIYPEKIKLYEKYFKTIPQSISLENQQAINRMSILRFYANEFKCLITGTSNKSEIAVGYASLCGDLQADLLPLGDLYKHEIYELAHYINFLFQIEKIPHFIITRKPSAELSLNQYDPFDYKRLDYFIYLKIEKLLSNQYILEIKKNGQSFFKKEEIEYYNQLIYKSEHKRKNSSLIFRIHKISFGKDRKIPILKKISYLI